MVFVFFLVNRAVFSFLGPNVDPNTVANANNVGQGGPEMRHI